MPRPSRRLLFTIGLVTAALIAVPAFVNAHRAEADSAAAAEETVNVWVWNVAGWKMHGGSTTNGMIDAAVSSIQNRDADFVAFNELCHNQYDALRTKLRQAGWPQDSDNFARFSVGHDTVCDGEANGNAIFSRRPLGAADRFTLPQDNSSQARTLLCAPVEAAAHLRFCTTHITPSNDVIDGEKINEQQLGYTLNKLEDYEAAGDAVVVAGDFNAQPNYGRMNGWYSSAVDTPNNSDNTGRYRELDDDDPDKCVGYGEYTAFRVVDPPGPCGDDGKKIDLIFVRENHLAGDYSGDSLAISQNCGGPCSDHRILIGTATVSYSA
ncbi:MAG: endonuclease/exonuclease/phosphatase family protein [Stackebrandtia sp.]